MAGLLVVGFIANFLMHPVAERFHVAATDQMRYAPAPAEAHSREEVESV